MCKAVDCSNKIIARGLCTTHYGRWRRTGTIEKLKPSKRLCSVEGCGKAHDSKGYCKTHVHRVRKYGQPQLPQSPSYVDRLEAKINKTTSCWLWEGTISRSGYGVVRSGNKQKVAHRAIYLELVGEIPEGMFLDHICHVRHCVNPEHLRIVTRAQNMQNLKPKSRTSYSGRRGVYRTSEGLRWFGSLKSFGVVHHTKRRELYELHIADYDIRKLRGEVFDNSSETLDN